MMDEKLSDLGMQRRQHILLLAQTVATRRRRRRSMSRGGGVTLMFAIAGLMAWSLTQLQSRPTPIPTPIVQLAKPIVPPTALVEYIATDPTITDRLSIKPQPPRWTSVSDTELLQELAAAGQPAGIVCMNGKTILLPR